MGRPSRKMHWWEPLLAVPPGVPAAAGFLVTVASKVAYGVGRPVLGSILLGLGLASAAAVICLHKLRHHDDPKLSPARLRATAIERLQALGFVVSELPGGRIIARRPWEALLVEIAGDDRRRCGVGPVRDLYGRIGANSANGCILVIPGEFTEAARGYALGKPILLWDRTELAAPPKRRPVTDQSLPGCHACGAPMRQRRSRTAGATQRPFLGCSRWPDCRATRSLPAGVEFPATK